VKTHAISQSEVPPLIDTHAHVFTQNMPFLANAWTKLNYDYTIDDYISTLDAHGIAYGVISGLSIAGTYNDYSLEAVRRHKRLRATAIVSPDIKHSELVELQREGFVGIRLQLVRMDPLPDFSSEMYRSLLKSVRELDWHVHVAIEGARLAAVVAQLEPSGVKIVLDHFGHPEPALGIRCPGYQAMLRAIDRGRTWVKLSAGFRLLGVDSWRTHPHSDAGFFAKEVAQDVVARVGTDRLFWGSDAPFVGYESRITYTHVLNSFEQWVPNPAQRVEISNTGMRFYFGDASIPKNSGIQP
jgi:predicted TIM-barrel fold metal-dependent hydrolase